MVVESPGHLCHLHTLPWVAPRDSPVDNQVSTLLRMVLLNACSIANKSFVLNDVVLSKKLDFLFLTETWQRNMELGPLIELCPKDYAFNSSPRLSGCFICCLVSTGSLLI